MAGYSSTLSSLVIGPLLVDHQHGDYDWYVGAGVWADFQDADAGFFSIPDCGHHILDIHFFGAGRGMCHLHPVGWNHQAAADSIVCACHADDVAQPVDPGTQHCHFPPGCPVDRPRPRVDCSVGAARLAPADPEHGLDGIDSWCGLHSLPRSVANREQRDPGGLLPDASHVDAQLVTRSSGSIAADQPLLPLDRDGERPLAWTCTGTGELGSVFGYGAGWVDVGPEVLWPIQAPYCLLVVSHGEY